jgi:hypothetical protein
MSLRAQKGALLFSPPVLRSIHQSLVFCATTIFFVVLVRDHHSALTTRAKPYLNVNVV